MPFDADRLREKVMAADLNARERRRILRGMRQAALAGARKGSRELGDIGIGIRSADVAGAVDPWVEARYPDLITRVNAETMRVVEGIVEAGLQDGLGADALGRKLEERFASWSSPAPGKQSRAEMIARTETGEAYNEATLSSYEQGGVTRVDVYDGDEDEICVEAVATSPWTVEAARLDKLGHPNCTRGFAPHIA